MKNPNQKKFTEQKEDKDKTNLEKKELDEPLPNSFKIVFCIFVGSLIAYLYKHTKEYWMPPKEVEIQETGRPMVGGPFDLVDHNGKQRTNEDFFGKYLLVYFGFVNCPDICPLAMKTVKDALKKCKEKNLPNINTAFISIDPRDTVEHLKLYSEREENPENIVCMTGPLEKLLEVTQSYRVYTNMVSIAKKIEEQKKSGIVEDENELLVDHSDFVYLINPKGEFLNVMNPRNLGVEKMVEKVAEEIAHDMQPGGKQYT